MSVGISPAINGEKEGQLPFWLMNIPRNQWPNQCPEFLINSSARDKRILSVPNDQYQRATWEEVQEYIRTNRLERFTRLPSDLRRYREYIYKLKQEYGAVVNFIVEKRLQWTEMKPEDKTPFANPSTGSICYVVVILKFSLGWNQPRCRIKILILGKDDFKILYNDWPYGVDTDIIHLVIWTKFQLEEDPATGDLTKKMRENVEDYIQRTFCGRISRENIAWHRNWSALKSIHAVEHIHVFLKGPDEDFIREITKGDTPAYLKPS